MRCFLFAFLLFAPDLSLCRADASDPNEKFYELATAATLDHDEVTIWPYEYSITWINGIRQSDGDAEFNLKPGDVVESLVCGARDRFVRYRLDKFTPTRAWFTRWIYSSVRTDIDGNTWKYQPGRLQLTDTCEVDLTNNGLLVDYGPNHLESGGRRNARSK